MPNPSGKNQYSGGRGGGSRQRSSPHISSSGKSKGSISRTDAAAAMFGRGSTQHKAAMKRFGK